MKKVLKIQADNLEQSGRHQTSEPVMVSFVGSTLPGGNFIFLNSLDVNIQA